MDSQWLFPLSALSHTPSWETSNISLDRELKDRAKGIEFIFRVAVHLALSNAVFSAAAQYFHRFYMRYSMEDYPRQEVAAASLFLATKTEENSRKIKDVSLVCYQKATGAQDVDSPEVQRWQTNILATEEILLGALCFDFIVDHPQADLVDMLEASAGSEIIHQYAWTLVNDSLRTPLCVLQPPRIIAAACFILAQRLVDGPDSASLDERIFSRSSASLPTPPHMHPQSPPSSLGAAQNFLQFSDSQMEAVATTITVLLDFYAAHSSADEKDSHLLPIIEVGRLTLPTHHQALYTPHPHPHPPLNDEQINGNYNEGGFTPASMGRTPHQSGRTPASDRPVSPPLPNDTTLISEPPSQVKADEIQSPGKAPRLDLS
ncbi:cyclin-like protein [Hysterangium stoloniferum]|nr:cyclin-like protein [Hysterangium stoloniferum]